MRTTDRQLANIKLADLLKKRALDQALNIKEFALLAGISYSQARHWFQLPGFPAIGSVVFWNDFVLWRQAHSGLTVLLEQTKRDAVQRRSTTNSTPRFTGRAAQILREAGCDL